MSCCEAKSSCQQKIITTKKSRKVALVGNPNCGKTTLFNALTGAKQRVGNWPGVTVERKSGYFIQHDTNVEVIDLPGIYSLTVASEAAIDERIACDFILANDADVIINVVDASHLERNLYLTTQLLEMGVPIILALNMIDVAEARAIAIDVDKLAKELNCPVIALSATKVTGVSQLKQAIVSYQPKKSHFVFQYPDAIANAITEIANTLQKQLFFTKYTDERINWFALRLIEGDTQIKKLFNAEDFMNSGSRAFARDDGGVLSFARDGGLDEDADILIADARYQFVNTLMKSCVTFSTRIKKTVTSRIDAIVLNRIFGIPIFLAVMYLLFFFAINIGGAFQDFFDISSQTIFVDGFAHVLTQVGAPTWLTVLLANGIGKGINTTVTFIPVIGAMFLFLALLEDSGYMARAAFVIDRFMRALGLPGKASVPMIVGFGCNVPAVMGARTLENKRDRILTIMMAPFMSCGARLAIYAVFTTAFFPRGGQNIVFALYLIGIGMAILTGFILRKSILQGDPSPLVMELPAYHMPHVKTLFIHAWQRLKGFVVRAGRLIVPICILIGALNSLNIDGTMSSGDADAHSLLSLIGKWVTPIFSPMGIQVSNWPATVGLVTGVLAKEVVVGTLNTLYTQMGHLVSINSGDTFSVLANLQQALKSIPENLMQLSNAFTNPVLAQAPIDAVNQDVYGLMYQQFDGQIGAFAYLLFVLLYFPCISTTAAMLRELHRGWAIFSALWMTSVAYGVAVLFYQSATLLRHPISSAIWIVCIITIFLTTIFLIHRFTNTNIMPRKVIAAGESK